MNKSYLKIKHVIYKNKFTFAIALVVMLTLISTITAVYIYVESGVSQLDLSRPGYKGVQKIVGEDQASEEFKSIGPINADVLNNFLSLYRKQQNGLSSSSDFGGETLSDSNLQLSPDSPPVNPE